MNNNILTCSKIKHLQIDSGRTPIDKIRCKCYTLAYNKLELHATLL